LHENNRFNLVCRGRHTLAADLPEQKFRAVTIDEKIKSILASRQQTWTAWQTRRSARGQKPVRMGRNPSWEKFVLGKI
jgi:hypothetical protein